MKVWLNNLKEGDIFYHILLDKVYKCKHLGDAHNMNFKMPRIKFEILDKDIIFNDNLLDNIHETFVNQYVYDNYEDAQNACIEEIKTEIKNTEESILKYKIAIANLEAMEQSLKDKLNMYERKNKNMVYIS